MKTENALIDRDPRGPLRRITAVGLIDRDDSGSYKPVTLDCGHTAHMNPIYSFTVGERQHCFACGQAAREDSHESH